MSQSSVFVSPLLLLPSFAQVELTQPVKAGEQKINFEFKKQLMTLEFLFVNIDRKLKIIIQVFLV